MKARDKVRLETLRNIKKVFIEAKTAPGLHASTAAPMPVRLLSKRARRGRGSPPTSRAQTRQDLADAELAQVAVIEEYLPKPLTEAEIEAAVKEIIAQTGAQGMKDMGRVMGMASKQMAGRADGSVISAIVKRLLA